MVKIIEQDIFTSDVEVIIHACNCFCTMGAGFAKQIKENYPSAYIADSQTESRDKDKLGTFSYSGWVERDKCKLNPNLKYIFNLYTQYDYGTDKRYTDYEAVASGLEKIKGYLIYYKGPKKIGIPYGMGAGLGGGDWRVINAIIESVFENSEFEILICKKS